MHILAAATLLLPLPSPADEYELYSLCEQWAGPQRQSFVVEESDGRLQVTQVYAAGDELLVRVFAAPKQALKSTDYLVRGELKLVLASLPDDYAQIENARITLGTEGEEGPIILSLEIRPQHEREPLVIVPSSKPVPCRTAGLEDPADPED